MKRDALEALPEWAHKSTATTKKLKRALNSALTALVQYADPRAWCSMGDGAYADMGKTARYVLDKIDRMRK